MSSGTPRGREDLKPRNLPGHVDAAHSPAKRRAAIWRVQPPDFGPVEAICVEEPAGSFGKDGCQARGFSFGVVVHLVAPGPRFVEQPSLVLENERECGAGVLCICRDGAALAAAGPPPASGGMPLARALSDPASLRERVRVRVGLVGRARPDGSGRISGSPARWSWSHGFVSCCTASTIVG